MPRPACQGRGMVASAPAAHKRRTRGDYPVCANLSDKYAVLKRTGTVRLHRSWRRRLSAGEAAPASTAANCRTCRLHTNRAANSQSGFFRRARELGVWAAADSFTAAQRADDLLRCEPLGPARCAVYRPGADYERQLLAPLLGYAVSSTATP
jgi:hypothetical protein